MLFTIRRRKRGTARVVQCNSDNVLYIRRFVPCYDSASRVCGLIFLCAARQSRLSLASTMVGVSIFAFHLAVAMVEKNEADGDGAHDESEHHRRRVLVGRIGAQGGGQADRSAQVQVGSRAKGQQQAEHAVGYVR